MDPIFSATIVVGFWIGSGKASLFFLQDHVVRPIAIGPSTSRCIIGLGIEPSLLGSRPDLILYFIFQFFKI